jgi:hypothetical protein
MGYRHRHIEMQLVTNPAFRVALGIALGSNRAVRRQIVPLDQHLRRRMPITALTTNARASAARSLGGRPGSPRHTPTSV